MRCPGSQIAAPSTELAGDGARRKKMGQLVRHELGNHLLLQSPKQSHQTTHLFAEIDRIDAVFDRAFQVLFCLEVVQMFLPRTNCTKHNNFTCWTDRESLLQCVLHMNSRRQPNLSRHMIIIAR